MASMPIRFPFDASLSVDMRMEMDYNVEVTKFPSALGPSGLEAYRQILGNPRPSRP